MKTKLIEIIKKKIISELHSLEVASKSTRSYSQSDDLKSEGKYDTRAIEAKYLAEAQELRVKTIRNELAIIEKLTNSSSRTVTIGSIVYCDNLAYFIIPISGQGTILDEEQKIQTISFNTQLAKEMIGLEVDDSFEHPISGKELHITKIV